MVEAIVEAAARILEERGLEGFNTNAVAERAGAGVGSLYQYFPNKDSLLAALIRREFEALHREIVLALAAARGRDLAADLAPLIAAAVRHQMARPRLARLLDIEEARLPLDAETDAIIAGIGGAVGDLLGRHAAALAASDPQEAAADVISIARGLIDGAARRGAVDAKALEARVARAVMGYLAWKG